MARLNTMEDTDTRVARAEEGKRALSRLSLTSWRASSSSPDSRPARSRRGRALPRASRTQAATPDPVSSTAFP